MKFRKKPIVIEAFKWTGDTKPFPQEWKNEVCCLSHDGNYSGNPHIHTLEGNMDITNGDWIIKGIAGEFYPCKPDIFEKTYEPSGINFGELTI